MSVRLKFKVSLTVEPLRLHFLRNKPTGSVNVLSYFQNKNVLQMLVANPLFDLYLDSHKIYFISENIEEKVVPDLTVENAVTNYVKLHLKTTFCDITVQPKTAAIHPVLISQTLYYCKERKVIFNNNMHLIY